jgi:hypothetical protein
MISRLKEQGAPGRPVLAFAATRYASGNVLQLHEQCGLPGRGPDALFASQSERSWFGGQRVGRRLIDRREMAVRATADDAFAAVRRIGGATGWYAYDGLWQLRGWIDRLFGGPGLRRGRVHSDALRVGDTIDCWRVVEFEPNRKLRLEAEMRLPGRAWLEFEVSQRGQVARIRQTTVFEPSGFAGQLYGFVSHPLHQLVFSAMLKGMVRVVANSEPRLNRTAGIKRLSPGRG